MSQLRPVFAFLLGLVIACALVLATGACTSPSVADPAADAPPAPLEPGGSFAVTSTLSLAAPPPGADAALDELLAAIDGPDDPSRYLLDLVIARLPDGRVRSYAEAVAPYAAAYLNRRIDEVAPHFVDGARALGSGLSRIAHRFGTIETLAIDPAGAAITTAADLGRRWFPLRRTVVGLRFDLAAGGAVVDVRFAPEGLPDLAALSRAQLEQPLSTVGERTDERLVIERHTIALPYAALLRLGFDRAVIPSVVPGAHDLADALVALVDCAHLGTLVSEWVGIGSPELYADACGVGLVSLAARIYARLDAIEMADVPLALTGAAITVDADRDTVMDALVGGAWSGTLADVPVSGTFAANRQ